MHESEEETHHEESLDRVAEPLLEKPPEIDLLGKGDASQLIERSIYRQHGEDLSCGYNEEPEGRQYDNGRNDADNDVLHRKFKVDLLLHEVGDGEKENRDEILHKRKGKGMIYGYQGKQRQVCV